MRSSAMAWGSMVGVMWLVAACGKSEGAAEPIPKSEIPARLAALLCEGRGGCCQQQGMTFATASCKTYYSQQLDESIAKYDPARVQYDAQAAGDCLAEFEARSNCGALDGDEVPACERVFRGKVALGGACTTSVDCAKTGDQRVICESSDGTAPSVCVLIGTGAGPHGKAGDACIFTCDEGDDCDGIAVAPPQPGTGVPQPDPVICYRDEGLYCGAGTCQPTVALGQPCANDGCEGGAFCDFATGICAARRPNGQPCTGDDECQSDSCPGAYDDDLELNGVCVDPSTLTAEQCAEDFMNPQVAPTEPAPGP